MPTGSRSRSRSCSMSASSSSKEDRRRCLGFTRARYACRGRSRVAHAPVRLIDAEGEHVAQDLDPRQLCRRPAHGGRRRRRFFEHQKERLDSRARREGRHFLQPALLVGFEQRSIRLHAFDGSTAARERRSAAPPRQRRYRAGRASQASMSFLAMLSGGGRSGSASRWNQRASSSSRVSTRRSPPA